MFLSPSRKNRYRCLYILIVSMQTWSSTTHFSYTLWNSLNSHRKKSKLQSLIFYRKYSSSHKQPNFIVSDDVTGHVNWVITEVGWLYTQLSAGRVSHGGLHQTTYSFLMPENTSTKHVNHSLHQLRLPYVPVGFIICAYEHVAGLLLPQDYSSGCGTFSLA